MAQREAVGRIHSIQRRLQVDVLVERIVREPRLLPGRQHTDVGLRQRVVLERGVVGRFGALGAGVDFEAGTLAGVQVLAVDLERHPRAGGAPSELVGGVRGSLARVFLVPVNLLVERRGEPGRTKRQPEIGRRDDREREVLLGELLGRIVEDVVIDAHVGERDRRIHQEGANANPDTVGVGCAVAALCVRRGSAQQRQHAHEHGKRFFQQGGPCPSFRHEAAVIIVPSGRAQRTR